MTTFAKVWALRSDTDLTPGSEVEVSLKSGSTKKVRVGTFIGKDGEAFLFSPAK